MLMALIPYERRSLYFGIFVISAGTLLLELALTRIFDVILQDNLAYLVVSSAIFGYAMAALFLLLWPMARTSTRDMLAAASLGFAGFVALLIPVFQWIPANLSDFPVHPFRQLLAFGVLYLFLLAPFVAAGLVICTAVTRYSASIHQLYFWDLFGAGTGCLAIFVLPSLIGAEPTLLVIGAAGALSATLFFRERRLSRQASLALAVALAVLAAAFANQIEVRSLLSKRGVRLGGESQRAEFSHWDPISKIDIFREAAPFRKHIAYDGGSQGSSFLLFDGDREALRQHYFDVIDGQNRYNSGKYVALAHWLKRDTSPRSLVLGSAGGQETLAALAWGGAHVDAVEMVCTVINAGKGPYADFIGRLFTNPRVETICDEGRSFLRHTNRSYDIIQIHSNHTTSSIAHGSGGAAPIYLETVEAYKEYLSHLSRDGILQINYFVYPRMITIAAQAWRELFPTEDFRRHLVVTTGYGVMPTFLVKRSEWTHDEIAAMRYFLGPAIPDPNTYSIIFAPGEPEASNVPDEFFQVPLSPRFEASLPYNISPPTDDRPFFRELRKEFGRVRTDERGYVPPSTADFINAPIRRFVPMDHVHLYLLGGLSVVVAALVIPIPLFWLRRQGLRRPEALPMLAYFACLGAGFIMVEVVLIYKFLLLVGFPIYSMATVLFTLLVCAGIGSYLSGRLSRALGVRSILVIIPFAVVVTLMIVAFPHLRELTLGMSQLSRILFVAALLVPIGIPLGMPFPLGIEALHSKAPDLIPWAWGVNGFMTVVGSLLSVILSIKFGFDVTLLASVAVYLVGMLSFFALSRTREQERPFAPP